METDETHFLAELFHEALEQTGWQADTQTLLERVRRLHLGLPAEDEFSTLLAWLGKCRLVHKLDQLQAPPESLDSYQVPDLLAIFEHEGQILPVLIEVKSKADKKLSWKTDYYERLKNYAQAVELPLLVAWKRGRIWSLFELKHFKRATTNLNISFVTAQKQNLLGILAGDFVIILRSGVGFHLVARKERRVSVEELAHGSRERWQAVIEKAYFTSYDGTRLRKLGAGLWSLFLTTSVEETSEVSDSGISYSLQVPSEEPIQWAHGALSSLLQLRAGEDNSVHWRQVLRSYAVPTEPMLLREGAKEGIDLGIVRYVLDQMPQELPDFLGPNAKASRFYKKLR